MLMRSMKTFSAEIIKSLTVLVLLAVFTGCTTSNGSPAGRSSLKQPEATAPGQIDTGLSDYREILSDLGPF